MPFLDGMFGAGTFGEAVFLNKQEKPIYEINLEGKIFKMQIDYKRRLTIARTRFRIINNIF